MVTRTQQLQGIMTAVALSGLAVFAPVALAQDKVEIRDSAQVQEIRRIASQMQPFTVRAVGLPTGASEWAFLEKPFWTDVIKELSGGKVTTQLNSMSELNLHGPEVFRLTAQGTFDVADIVANYGAGDLPQLDAMDLAGVASTTAEQKKVLESYAPIYRKALKDRFNIVSLGEAHSTAQVFFCKGEVTGIGDLRGKKVRLTSSTLADLVSGLGGTPVTMTFAEAVPALQRGVIDCVITGTMSGNTGKLYEVTNTLFAMPVGWAPRVRIASGRFMDRLDATQREFMTKISEWYFGEFGEPVELRNNNEGIWCSVGDARCTLDGKFGVRKASMTLTEMSAEDKATLKQVVERNVLPNFVKACGATCASEWNATVGQTMSLTAR